MLAELHIDVGLLPHVVLSRKRNALLKLVLLPRQLRFSRLVLVGKGRVNEHKITAEVCV